MNWMLPLETLPGWPEAADVSYSQLLFLILIAPLAVGVVVSLLAWTPKLAARFRGEEPAAGTEVARREQAPSPEHAA
ncbi:hypothetical protein FOJ82_02020 [Tessaracoccus rhinocerotis]|uniref:Uncharacterized protein n=1 Tax=Tessaracoccus rhinocerotis TaxID=1689449 RepID=A0A553K4Q7_9ACTN|nr:hypothetical protein [Tessaracoccus rhinocerotis]TRY19686.1 hypothetical protein FOJ82_02020 [Tessaracoccus rhinocerotis]